MLSKSNKSKCVPGPGRDSGGGELRAKVSAIHSGLLPFPSSLPKTQKSAKCTQNTAPCTVCFERTGCPRLAATMCPWESRILETSPPSPCGRRPFSILSPSATAPTGCAVVCCGTFNCPNGILRPSRGSIKAKHRRRLGLSCLG